MTINIFPHKSSGQKGRHHRRDEAGQLYLVMDRQGRLVDTYRVGLTTAGPVSGLSVVSGLPTVGFQAQVAS
jgi:hypothetical protein